MINLPSCKDGDYNDMMKRRMFKLTIMLITPNLKVKTFDEDIMMFNDDDYNNTNYDHKNGVATIKKIIS